MSAIKVTKIYSTMLALKLTLLELFASNHSGDAFFEKVALGTNFATLWNIIFSVSLK
jgi:hypothetical protein